MVIGASKQAQLDDNLGAVNVALSAEDIAALDEATAPTPAYPATVVGVFDQPIATALATRPTPTRP